MLVKFLHREESLNALEGILGFGLAGACLESGLPVRRTKFPGGRRCVNNCGHVTTRTIGLFGNYFCNIQSRGKAIGRVLLPRNCPQRPWLQKVPGFSSA